jgi:hypothetical protein
LVEKISQQFSHCFNSYAQAYNKTYKRKGSLFKESFQRRLIDSDEYLRTAISYVHFNPVKDGFVRLPQEWKHSSFREFLEDQKKPTRKISSALLKEEVLELFGSLREMVEYSPLAYDFDKEQPRRGL